MVYFKGIIYTRNWKKLKLEHDLTEVMFETKTRGELELERRLIASIEYSFEDRLAIAVVTQQMYKDTDTTEDQCEYIASIPRQISGVMVGVTIKERKNGTYKASLRTRKPLNAATICEKVGGGGHSNAAGCRFSGSLEEFKQALREAVAEELK